MIGIYKITSPTKKVYIGQSIDIEKRFNHYESLKCKAQPAIYNSLLKYGFEKHKFEVLCECNIDELNDKERYYQDIFSATGKNGLNCRLTTASDRSGNISENARKKMSESGKIKIFSDNHIKKMSESKKGERNPNFGKKHSEETLKKISESMKREKHPNFGKTRSKEIIKKISQSNTGKKRNEESLKRMSEASIKRIILNTETGIFYNGIKDAAESININRSTLQNILIGKIKNKTNLIYV